MRALAALPVLVAIAAVSVMAAKPVRATTFDLEALTWQGRAVTAAKFVPIEALELPKNQKVAGRFKAALKFLNRGPAVDGVLIRYSVEAKIAPDDHLELATWAVPFMIDERRVPKVAANSHFEAPLDPSTMTEIYVKNLALEGYVVQEIKLRAMISPRRGRPGPVQVLESELPVHWKAP